MGSILVIVPNSKQGYNFGQKWAELPDLKVGINKSGQKHFFIFQILRMYIILCQPFCFISLSFFYILVSIRSICILQVIIGGVLFRQGIILI